MKLDGLADPLALPTVTDVNRPFFSAAAEGRLVLPRCVTCGTVFFYPRLACPECLSAEIEWTEASGRGTVVVATPIHRPPWNDLARPVPYVLVIVQLHEGPRMMSTVEGVDPAAVQAGMAVQACFERVSDEIGLVRFVPATAAAGSARA